MRLSHRESFINSRKVTVIKMNEKALSAEQIFRFIKESPTSVEPSIRIYDTLDSTNTLLKCEAERGAAHGSVVIARKQTAGRGRMGRSFFSPDGTGIYMSILVRPELCADESLFITTLTALATARALDSAGCGGAEIKWVNDIFVGGKKAAGILVEGALDESARKLKYAVVGIGINLYSPERGFPSELSSIACGAFDGKSESIDQNRLAADIICEFFSLYDALPCHDFMDEYRRRSCIIGKEVSVSVGDESFNGTAVDIDENARLIVRLPSGETRVLCSGEARAKL